MGTHAVTVTVGGLRRKEGLWVSGGVFPFFLNYFGLVVLTVRTGFGVRIDFTWRSGRIQSHPARPSYVADGGHDCQ